MNAAPATPRRTAIFRCTAFFLSGIAFLWFLSIWRNRASVVQSHDIYAYLWTTLPPLPFDDNYRVVMSGNYLATSSDIFDLTVQRGKYDHDKLYEWLQRNVYGAHPLPVVLIWPIVGFALTLLLSGTVGWYLDRRIGGGSVLRGPRIVSNWRWNLGIRRKRRGFYVESR